MTRYRTHSCGELRLEHAGQRVKLAGQLQRKSVKERARGIRKGLRADDSDPVMLHRVAVNGVEGYFTFDLFNPGEITQENLQQYMLEAGQYCTDMNEYYKMLWDLLSGYDSGSYSISRRADDDDETEITVTIEGTLKQVNTWTAEYLGCYEDSSDDNLYLAPARSKRFKKH